MEPLTPEEAIRGCTIWGAWAEFLDDVTGVVWEGMRADLTDLEGPSMLRLPPLGQMVFPDHWRT